MSNLFIIGNGFDIAHNLKTSYADFQRYLQKRYPNANGEKLIIPGGTLTPRGGVSYDDDEVVSFLMYMISQAESNGDKWSDLENTLGKLDFGECLDNPFPVFDKDGDYDNWKNMYIRQDTADNLVVPCLMIKDFFSDWINTIEVNNATKKNDFAKLIDKNNDLFLTFNYTETLEVIYNAKNVCHIHGKKGENLIFGHGNNKDNYEENVSKYTGAEDSLRNIQDALKKNTVDALVANADFFDEISSCIDKIYSFGFSFSEVDQIYVTRICESLHTESVVWYLLYRPSDPHDSYRSIIRKCGFKGRFGTFYIDR